MPQSESQRLAARDRYFPDAKSEDWRLQVAGQRVETIKPDARRGGLLELGTALVAAADRSLVALLGASPGASTAAFIAISVLEKCFANELTADGWLPKLRRIIPSYGVSLIYERDCLRRIRAERRRFSTSRTSEWLEEPLTLGDGGVAAVRSRDRTWESRYGRHANGER